MPIFNKRKRQKKLITYLDSSAVTILNTPTIQDELIEASQDALNEAKIGINKLGSALSGQTSRVIDSLQSHNVLSFIEDARQPQLRAVTTAQGKLAKKLSPGEKKANFVTNISIVATGLAVGGKLLYPPIALLSVPILVYRLGLLGQDSYQKIKEDRGSFNVEMIEFVTSLALLTQGYLIIAALDNVLFGIARILIEKVKHESKAEMFDVFHQQPRSVWTLVEGVEVSTPIEDIQQGDVVVVYAGETIPIDGKIVGGAASVDQQILTGEAQPDEKSIGESAFALTVVLSGGLHIEVEHTGQETAAAQINQILNKTVDYKTGRMLWSEEIADKTVAPLLLLTAISFPVIGFASAMAVMDSHFKRKMSIAGAISILNVFKQASQNGILIKDGRTLELMTKIDTVVFDKTGTLTMEQPHVGQIYTYNGCNENEILQYAANAEFKQTHPIARAITQAAEERGLGIEPQENTEYKVGYGLTVVAQDKTIRVGSIRFIEMEGLPLPDQLHEARSWCDSQGHSLVMVALDDEVVGAVELRATVRPEAKAIIEGLRQRNVKSMYIISGDHEAPTRKLAEELGIKHYFAEVLPENKASLIEQLQAQGRSVCFVGDGINDSIALKTANVSVSLRGASSIAVDTAHVILMDQSLNRLTTLFDIAAELDKNTNSTFLWVLAPCVICLNGALFLGFTQVSSIFLNLASLGLGVGNAMVPALKAQSNSLPKPKMLQ